MWAAPCLDRRFSFLLILLLLLLLLRDICWDIQFFDDNYGNPNGRGSPREREDGSSETRDCVSTASEEARGGLFSIPRRPLHVLLSSPVSSRCFWKGDIRRKTSGFQQGRRKRESVSQWSLALASHRGVRRHDSGVRLRP